MGEAKKTRRSITAVRQWKIVVDAMVQHNVGVDEPVHVLIEKLQNAALDEVANQ